MQVHHVFQQSGFKRVKRGWRAGPGEAAAEVRDGPKRIEKKNSWSELRASLDLGEQVNPAVVHPEDYYEQVCSLSISFLCFFRLPQICH